jgi:flagellar motor switch protein FliN
MNEKIELEQLHSETEAPGGRPGAPSDLRRLSDVPVEVAVEMGRANMTVGETLELRHGSIVTLNRMAGEPVDLLVNGTVIARGEVVVIDEQFGLRITDVLGAGATGEASTPAAAENGDADVVAASEAAASIG